MTGDRFFAKQHARQRAAGAREARERREAGEVDPGRSTVAAWVKAERRELERHAGHMLCDLGGDWSYVACALCGTVLPDPGTVCPARGNE